MLPLEEFADEPPEFWAVVKLVSAEIGYSLQKTKSRPSAARAYTSAEVATALRARRLDPSNQAELVRRVAEYSVARAELLRDVVRPSLMNREEAEDLFNALRAELDPPDHLLSMNKQKGSKRHYAFLACIVNMLTWKALTDAFGEASFDHNPRGPLTFSRDGMPLRTLFRWMDGAYPGLNHPVAAWEIKEYYGTTTFGSRVADGVYETALDGYELNDLRDVDVEVKHYLFLDDRFTWWDCGKSYLCRIVDMLHADCSTEPSSGGRSSRSGRPWWAAGQPPRIMSHQVSSRRSATSSRLISSPVIWKRLSMHPPRSIRSSLGKRSSGRPSSMSLAPERLQPSTETATLAPRAAASATFTQRRSRRKSWAP